MTLSRATLAYADPPYPGCAKLYRDHPDYAGEVDHRVLVRHIDHFDGWILHTASTTLGYVLGELAAAQITGWRVMAWVKPFAAFKRNVSVAYAWEPVIVKPVRKPAVEHAHEVSRDWLSEPITLQRGLTGAKPERVCRWLFDVAGCRPGDELADLFPGTGAVSHAWERWSSEPTLFAAREK
jgi:hypothetical protein